MSDLIERLRSRFSAGTYAGRIFDEAADEIERLRQIEKSYIALNAITTDMKAEIERLQLVIENYRLGGRWKGSEIDDIIEDNTKLQAVVDAAKVWRDENEWPMYYDYELLEALAKLENE